MVGERRWWEIPVNKLGLEGYTPRLKGHQLEISEQDLADIGPSAHVKLLVEHLNAEQERLMRLLPDPPEGFHWDFEIQQHHDFIKNMAYFRTVATLKEDI
jgi:hypothetical protein